MVISPRIKGFICITAHPDGCRENVRRQMEYVEKNGKTENGPKNVLIIGASTGYGLASRIALAFGSGANTLGIMFEKNATATRTAMTRVDMMVANHARGSPPERIWMMDRIEARMETMPNRVSTQATVLFRASSSSRWCSTRIFSLLVMSSTASGMRLVSITAW